MYVHMTVYVKCGAVIQRVFTGLPMCLPEWTQGFTLPAAALGTVNACCFDMCTSNNWFFLIGNNVNYLFRYLVCHSCVILVKYFSSLLPIF
jgi:hypothetical protein